MVRSFEFEEIEAVNDESKSRSIYPTDWFNMVTLDPTTGKQYLFAEASPPSNSTELTMADNYYPSDMLNLVTLGPGDGKKYLVSNQPATWFEGCYFCNAHGMDLVTIETKEENDAIVDHLDKIGYKNSYTFTSGHKIGRASYLWINGEYMLYSDWAPGQPSQEVTENCMIVWRNDWYDLPCNWTASFSSYFICEERIFLTNSNVDEF
ncbi:hypothetical protein B566_EDAN015075, partial [Ephemera danica]